MQINVLEYFEKGPLRECPEKTVVVDGEATYSVKDVERLSKRVASVILRAGGFKNRPIAVYLPKSANVIFADLGIMYSGNIYVNLDVKSPAQRMKSLIENIRPELVITCKEFAGFAEQFGLDPGKVVIIEDAIAEDVRYDNEAILRGLEGLIDTDPLCIINTSGSTGLQKSAILSHRGFIDFTDWAVERLRIGEDEVIGSLSPVFFDIYSFELCLLLARSATIVLIPEKLAGFPARLMEFMRTAGVNFIFWVPTVMVNMANLDILGKVELPPLRTVWYRRRGLPDEARQLLAEAPAGDQVRQSLRPDRDHPRLRLLRPRPGVLR